jgi:hypothetical protein
MTHTQLVWPIAGQGRFPFAGHGTEVMNVNEREKVTVYRVPVARILKALGIAIAEQQRSQ